MESALVFLANAAGEIAKADERDNIDAQSKYDQIEASLSGANSHRVSIDESMNHQQQQEQLHPHYQQKLQQNHHHHKPPQQELHHLQPLNIPNNAPEGFTNNHRIQTEQPNTHHTSNLQLREECLCHQQKVGMLLDQKVRINCLV